MVIGSRWLSKFFWLSGVNQGTTTWPGPASDITDFTISFTGLPAGVTIDPALVGNFTFSSSSVLSEPTFIGWAPVLSNGNDTITFTAPTGISLNSGDQYVCGSGSSGSVVARRLGENPDVQVLLVKAGGCDDVPEVREAIRWPANYESATGAFLDSPAPYLNGRRMPLPVGKVLGGGSSINAMAWAWGHKNDWDYFAAEAGDDAWIYDSVVSIYRRIEDWQGDPDSDNRGIGGPVFVQLAPDPSPLGPAMLQAAYSVGIPTFAGHNGRMMETGGGASLLEMRLRDGQRLSVFRS